MENINEKNEEQLKKRGRKKKILQETENKIHNFEKLQIEQVKKKRGRKKKWEVETTTKLIENCPISFSENNINKEEIKQIDHNYEEQNILFGTLNIKVHSNKDNVQINDIKNNLRTNNNLCKINLTSSDFENSDNEDINNLNNVIDKKISLENKTSKNNNSKKKIEKNMKIMKFFTNEFDSGNEILVSPYRCYNCHHNFNNKPFFLPIDYHYEKNKFKVTGNFCSPNCVKSYALNSKIYQNKFYLIGDMYRKLFGSNYIIKPAPPIQTLKVYGGNLSIEEFRKNFDNSIQYSIKNIFSKVIMDEVICN